MLSAPLSRIETAPFRPLGDGPAARRHESHLRPITSTQTPTFICSFRLIIRADICQSSDGRSPSDRRHRAEWRLLSRTAPGADTRRPAAPPAQLRQTSLVRRHHPRPSLTKLPTSLPVPTMAWYKHTPTNLGWFFRGTQSAIFFYVSCAPCAMRSARNKQRKENKRAMAERDQQMRLAEGMLYAQPLPYQTNAAWMSEIDLGAERLETGADDGGDVKKGRGEAKGSKVELHGTRASSPSRPSTIGMDARHRPPSSKATEPAKNDTSRLTTDTANTWPQSRREGKEHAGGTHGHGEETAASHLSKENITPAIHVSTEVTPPERNTPSTTTGHSRMAGTNSSLSTTLVADSTATEPSVDDASERLTTTSHKTSGSDGTEKKSRYQRPLEPLWGITAGFGPPSRLNGVTDPAPEPAWYVKRNPEVNELHPPVVSSLPKSKKEALWMLQPPPPAAFMEGRLVKGALPTRTASARTRSATTTTARSRPGTATTRSASQTSNHVSASSRQQRRRRDGESPTRRPRKSKHPKPSPTPSVSSQEMAPRRKRRPAPLSTINSSGL